LTDSMPAFLSRVEVDFLSARCVPSLMLI
jgi:hypothetical protein